MWRLAKIWVSITTTFFLTQMIVLAGTGLANGEYADPFALYKAMMPGQPAAVSGNCAWRYETIPASMGEQIYCEIYPSEGSFVSVFTDVHNVRFVGISFYANDLYVGDIVRHWGGLLRSSRVARSFTRVGTRGSTPYWIRLAALNDFRSCSRLRA